MKVMLPRGKKRQKLANKILVLFGIIILLESSFLLVIFGLLEDSEKRLADERQARAVQSAIAKLSGTLQFISMSLINQTRYRMIKLKEINEVFTRLPDDLEGLEKLVNQTPYGSANIEVLKEALPDALELVRKVNATLQRPQDDGGTRMIHYHYCIQLVDMSRDMTRQIDDLEDTFREIEEGSGNSLVMQPDALIYTLLFIGFSVNAAIAVALYWLFVRNITTRLDRVADNTVRVTVGQPLLTPLAGDDEVSDLDEAFRDMAESLEEFRTKEAVILQNAANFICSINPRGIFVSVPEASSAMWGYTTEELIGRRFSSVATEEHFETTRIALESLTEPGNSASFENQIRCASGKILDLAWTANFNDDGNIVCIAHEVTERKRIVNLIQKSEERFRSIVEQVPLAIVNCDRFFMIESVNSATTGMFHYQSSELLGKRLDVLLGDPRAGKTIDSSSQLNALKEHALKQPVELNVWRKDGSSLSTEVTMSAYSGQQGERYLICFRDISLRLEIESAKRDFVAMVSHDLRSPLTSIYGTLGLITMNDTGPASAPFAEAEKKVNGLIDLINDFLDLGKVEEGRTSLNLEDVVLSKQLGAALHVIELAMDARDVEVDLIDPAEDPIVTVDRDRFNLAIGCLMELIVNFNAPDKKLTISSLVKKPSSGKAASLQITIRGSSGSRLPDVVKETCLEGYRLIPLEESFKSSALRLALTRTIIEMHNGRLTVSELDDADAFEITLPVQKSGSGNRSG